MFDGFAPGSPDGIRISVVRYLILLLAWFGLLVALLSFMEKSVPASLDAVIGGGIISLLSVAVQSLFKSREELQSARLTTDIEKAKCAEVIK